MSITITNKNGIETTFNTGLKSTGYTEVKPYIEPKAKTKRYGYRPKFKLGANNIIMSILTGASVTGYKLAFGNTPESVDAIFDAARTVNSTFADMSNDEIIDYCSDLSNEQMQGMVSLVHGRYFEEFASDATDGILHASMNHPDTDMTLDGIEISIKSNDATADAITGTPTMSPQDFSMDDQELRETTSDVLEGGSDVAEAIVDGLLTTTVGLGTIASIKAVGNSAKEWKKLDEDDKDLEHAALFIVGTGVQAAYGTIIGGLTAIGYGYMALDKLFSDDEPKKQDYCHRN